MRKSPVDLPGAKHARNLAILYAEGPEMLPPVTAEIHILNIWHRGSDIPKRRLIRNEDTEDTDSVALGIRKVLLERITVRHVCIISNS